MVAPQEVHVWDEVRKVTFSPSEAFFILQRNGLTTTSVPKMLKCAKDGMDAKWESKTYWGNVEYHALMFNVDDEFFTLESSLKQHEASTLNWMLSTSVAQYDLGCAAGMSDARNVAERRRFTNVYEMMKLACRDDNHSNINTAYAKGYVAGWTSVTSGVMA